MTKTAIQQLEECKRRHAALQERRTRAQVKLEAERKALAEAEAEALALFGTADIDKLREIFQQRQAENESKVAAFAAELDAVERRVADIERQVSTS
jgi:polyhydroxyalkanoate synthesis regulator phasin